MNQKMRLLVGAAVAGAALFSAQSAMAACAVSHAQLTTAAQGAAVWAQQEGFGLPMWVTFVDETGAVCAVTTSSPGNANAGALTSRSQWLGSRVISAQKANTANAFSLNGYAISTANLYSAVNPGGSLYGLQHSNPVDGSRAYLGNANNYGKANDPLVGKRVGGVNVFGGGLAVYIGGNKVGAIGVSGDTSCADHTFAWKVRQLLSGEPTHGTGITTANYLPDGTGATPLAGATVGDEMIVGTSDAYWGAWSQPSCPNDTATLGVLRN